MKTTLIIDRKFVFEFVIEVVSKMYGISDWFKYTRGTSVGFSYGAVSVLYSR